MGALKRLSGRYSRKYLKCLKCDTQIERPDIQDNIEYTCPKCGQVHFVDITKNYIALTVVEQPELRHRHMTDNKATIERLKKIVAAKRELEERTGQ